MSPREYGEEFVHFIVGHLLHVCGTFGFVGDARLAEGLHALVGDSQALAAVAFRVFDADGDGAVTPADLATVLSLAKPFFAVTHVALEAKFAAALAQAGASVRAGGVREDAFSKTMEGVPMLKAWTLVPTRRAAEWLARRATVRAATNAEQAMSPPPPPPRLLPPPGRASRRDELERARLGGAPRGAGPDASAAGGTVAAPADATTARPSEHTEARLNVRVAEASEVAADGIREPALSRDALETRSDRPGREDVSALAVQERELEAKMRAEVLAKRRRALSGMANAKEWNYAAYQHRSRRIEPALGAARGVDLERATRDRAALAEKRKKTENGARRW